MRIKVVPTWVFHGDADTVVSIEQSRRLEAALRAAGATVRYTEISATGHNDGVDKIYGTVELVTWLLAQRRRTKALQASIEILLKQPQGLPPLKVNAK
jgi:predicted peptidase